MFWVPSLAPARPPVLLRYGVALGIVVVALLLSLLFRPIIDPNPFILFFAAVAISAWYSGLWAGLLSAILSLVMTDYFIISPFRLSLFIGGELIRGAVFFFVAGLISYLSEAHRQAEATARAQGEHFRVVLASIGDAVIATDAAGRVTFLNSTAEALTGWSFSEVTGHQVEDIFHIVNASTQQPIENPVARVLREGTIAGLANHTLLIARDGTARPIDDSGAPIKDAAGRLIGVVLVFRDITERANAEAALQASRDQLDVILRGIADGIVAEVPGGKLVYANDVAAHATGYTSAQAMLDATSPERLQRFVIMDEAGQPLPAAQLPGRRALQGEEHPSQIIRYRNLDTGHERWTTVQARPVRDAHNQTVMSIAIMHDITAEKEAEAERARSLAREQAARAEAEAAVRLRDQFLSIAAHELRTPLTTLMGNIQLFQRRAKRDGHLPERDQRTLYVINDQVGRLNKMVQALLDVSRLEQGQLSIEHVPLDLCALVRQVVAEVRSTLDTHVIHLLCPDGPLLVNGDALRLEQVLQNLIQNALKYSPQHDSITVEVRQQSDWVYVAVQDHGIGIPQSAMPQLFQRFYRADNVEKQNISGMGIGLYVVNEIITLHGGEITVDSAEGIGSTFTICLPLDTSTGTGEQS